MRNERVCDGDWLVVASSESEDRSLGGCSCGEKL